MVKLTQDFHITLLRKGNCSTKHERPADLFVFYIEQQAKQVYGLRNQFRTQTRELMADTEQANEYFWKRPNLTWGQVIRKYSEQGFNVDTLWKEIINASQRPRQSVNKSLGL